MHPPYEWVETALSSQLHDRGAARKLDEGGKAMSLNGGGANYPGFISHLRDSLVASLPIEPESSGQE